MFVLTKSSQVCLCDSSCKYLKESWTQILFKYSPLTKATTFAFFFFHIRKEQKQVYENEAVFSSQAFCMTYKD